MRTVRNAVISVLLLALGVRLAAALISPLIPVLIALSLVVVLVWLVLGRPKG